MRDRPLILLWQARAGLAGADGFIRIACPVRDFPVLARLFARFAVFATLTGCYLSHGRPERDAAVVAFDAAARCEGVACESPPSECYQRTGACTGEGVCEYLPRDGASCDDGDPCTEADTCARTVCVGTAIVCPAAPTPSCVDARTLRNHEGVGACSAGACSYPSTDVTCPFGCEAGRCASCTPVPWTTTTIDTMDRMRGGTTTLMTTSIAADRVGGVHVAYQDGDLDRDLCYAHRAPDGEWTRSVIDFEGFGAAVLSLALNDAGAHAFFIDLGPAPFAGHYASQGLDGAWTTERVESAVADNGYSYPSFAVDGAGGAHVSSGGHGDLRYAYRDLDGGWTTRTVDPEPTAGALTSLAVDGVGGVHIAYGQSVGVVGSMFALRHAYRGADGEWTSSTIDAAVANMWVLASLAGDGSGTVHVGYFHFPTGTLRVASRSPEGAWTTSTVDADVRSGGGGQVSLAADDDGGVHVAYGDGVDGRLHYAFRGAAETWRTTTVEAADYGVNASLAVDHADGVHIVYYDWTTMSLRHAYQRVCR